MIVIFSVTVLLVIIDIAAAAAAAAASESEHWNVSQLFGQHFVRALFTRSFLLF